jgi:hypothetical protein
LLYCVAAFVRLPHGTQMTQTGADERRFFVSFYT